MCTYLGFGNNVLKYAGSRHPPRSKMLLPNVLLRCITLYYNVLHSGTELEFNEGDENGLGNK
jgi:hypothetical protein